MPCSLLGPRTKDSVRYSLNGLKVHLYSKFQTLYVGIQTPSGSEQTHICSFISSGSISCRSLVGGGQG